MVKKQNQRPIKTLCRRNILKEPEVENHLRVQDRMEIFGVSNMVPELAQLVNYPFARHPAKRAPEGGGQREAAN